jgi:hypothetical protein
MLPDWGKVLVLWNEVHDWHGFPLPILAPFLLVVIVFINNLLDGHFPFLKTHRQIPF